jgi:hypothetical protein
MSRSTRSAILSTASIRGGEREEFRRFSATRERSRKRPGGTPFSAWCSDVSLEPSAGERVSTEEGGGFEVNRGPTQEVGG